MCKHLQPLQGTSLAGVVSCAELCEDNLVMLQRLLIAGAWFKPCRHIAGSRLGVSRPNFEGVHPAGRGNLTSLELSAFRVVFKRDMKGGCNL